MIVLRRWLATILLAVLMASLIMPDVAIAGTEMKAELVYGNGEIIFQNQYLLSKPSLYLFHRQTSDISDVESFEFTAPPASDGFNIAQRSEVTGSLDSVGLFRANWNYLEFTNPASMCYPASTSDRSSIHTSKPIGYEYIWPYMIDNTIKEKSDAIKNEQAQNPISIGSMINPNINFKPKLSAFKNNSDTNKSSVPNSSSNRELSCAANPKNPYVANTSNTKWGWRSTGMTAGIENALFPHMDPKKACREDIQNFTGWDRMVMNTLGGSRIDKIYQGTVAAPTNIDPKVAVQFVNFKNVLDIGHNMTKPNTTLKSKFWCL